MSLLKTKLLSLCIASLLLLSCSKPDAYDSEGKPIYLRDYAGKWIVLNYWASWCKPCYAEMPDLNRFFATYPDKVMVFGINFDHIKPEELESFKKQWNISFPLIDSDLGLKFGVTQPSILPTTVLISPKGDIAEIMVGPQTPQNLADKMQLKKVSS